MIMIMLFCTVVLLIIPFTSIFILRSWASNLLIPISLSVLKASVVIPLNFGFAPPVLDLFPSSPIGLFFLHIIILFLKTVRPSWAPTRSVTLRRYRKSYLWVLKPRCGLSVGHPYRHLVTLLKKKVYGIWPAP